MACRCQLPRREEGPPSSTACIMYVSVACGAGPFRRCCATTQQDRTAPMTTGQPFLGSNPVTIHAHLSSLPEMIIFFLSTPPHILLSCYPPQIPHLSLSLCNANCVLVFHVILSYLYFRIIDAIKRDKREKGGGDGGMCVTMLRTLYIYNAPYVQAIKMA